VQHRLSGRAILEDVGIGGVVLTLVDAADMNIVDTAVTGPDGAYSFEKVPDGDYKLKITLPEDMTRAEIGEWLSVGSKTEFTVGSGGKDILESMDIHLCLKRD
jgi:hypothetical protein